MCKINFYGIQTFRRLFVKTKYSTYGFKEQFQLSNRNEIMSCFFNRVMNTRFAALLLPQVKINTTDYTDPHRLRKEND